jgi:hypothetical protein
VEDRSASGTFAARLRELTESLEIPMRVSDLLFATIATPEGAESHSEDMTRALERILQQLTWPNLSKQ